MMIPTVLLLSLLAPRLIPDPCTLISKADVQAFIGEPVANMAKEEPEPDEVTGGTIATCTFAGKTRMLFVSVVEFKSATEATKKITAQFLKDRDEDTTVESEPGLGDRAFYGRSAQAAMILAQKGARAFAVGIGGKGGADGAAFRARLHKLVAGVMTKG